MPHTLNSTHQITRSGMETISSLKMERVVVNALDIISTMSLHNAAGDSITEMMIRGEFTS